MKKIFKKIHLWISLPFGIIIAIICISGSILVFEKELLEMVYPSRYFVKEVKGEPLPVGKLMKAARQQIPETAEIAGIQITKDPKRTYQVNLPGRSVCYFIDPYTAEITAFQDGRDPFFLTTMRLHRWLLGEYKRDGSFSLGKTVVGISTIFMVFILISGIVIWFPKTRKGLKPRLKIVGNKGALRFFHDLHVAGGIYTVLVLLVLSLTGLTWSFGWYRNAFYKVFGVETTMQAPAPNQGGAPQQGNLQARQEGRPETGSNREPGAERKPGEGFPQGNRPGEGGENRAGRGEDNSSKTPNAIQWNKALAAVESLYPDYKTITLQAGTASVSTSNYGNSRGSDRVTFDPQTGEIKAVQLYKEQPKSGKIRGWIYSVHVGSWGGMVTRIITCLSSLLGGVFALTGYWFWWRKRQNKKGRANNPA